MPLTLAERCIKAGTSERGVCPACGSPWERVVEREKGFTARIVDTGGGITIRSDAALDADYRGIGCTRSQTLGWQPSCSCPAADPIPAIVFDPFSGAGTTGLAASMLGRRYVGTDLSREYLDMSVRRIREGLRPVSRFDPPRPIQPTSGQGSLLDLMGDPD